MGLARAVIERNLNQVRYRIAEAARRAGRSPGDVQLIAVTKTVGLAETQALIDFGVTHLAENRPEVAGSKITAVGHDVCWHMIGNVQRRKVPEILSIFDTIDAVDRLEVAETLEKKCAERGKYLPVLIEVNASGEHSKHGFAPDALDEVLARMAVYPHVQVNGFLTMAPFVAEPEMTRPVFAALKKLGDRYGLRELSMGMSNDFEIAIEEGATQVRIGSLLFAE